MAAIWLLFLFTKITIFPPKFALEEEKKKKTRKSRNTKKNCKISAFNLKALPRNRPLTYFGLSSDAFAKLTQLVYVQPYLPLIQVTYKNLVTYF